MNELILFLTAFWFPIFMAVLILSFWLLSKFVSAKLEKCVFCEGKGRLSAYVDDSQDLREVNCNYCRGTGKKPKKEDKENGH